MPEAMKVESMMKETMENIAVSAIAGTGSFFLTNIYHYTKQNRLNGGLQALCMKVPQAFRYVTLVTGVLGTIDCTMRYVRQKDDELNKLTTGAAAVGLYTIPHGGLGREKRIWLLCNAVLALYMKVPTKKSNTV